MYWTERIESLLEELYEERAGEACKLVRGVLDSHLASLKAKGAIRTTFGLDQPQAGDVFLITYGNTLAARGDESSLEALHRFAIRRLSGWVSYVHILPFFPYSSDDGFSVIDYRTVNPDLGNWLDVETLGRDFKLAFDLVINHASSQGTWFREFLHGNPKYSGWFITRPDGYDASRVARPRTHPLLTPYSRADGSRLNVWTTFSADQVDLNFSNPAVLAEMLDVFLCYVEKGARIVRLDAIAYLWKEDGHTCIHHPKTHSVVKLFRAIVDALDLNVLILTETNVPHTENISYFGSGDEAHMVYNFALPPLTLHAFTTGDAAALSSWARDTRAPKRGLFLNFLASHDGIGLLPAYGLVDEESFRRTLEVAVSRGGLISYKSTPSGPVPYELNSSWFDALSDPGLPEDVRVRAHLASHALAASLDGMPAVYIHSLLGTGNWSEGPSLKGYNRAINRRQLYLDEVESALRDPDSRTSRTLRGMRALYAHRGREPALAPGAPSRVLSREGPVFAIIRGGPGGRLLCAVNVTSKPARFEIPEELLPLGAPYDPTDDSHTPRQEVSDGGTLYLEPYGVLWRPYA